jgi:hypothetical protein
MNEPRTPSLRLSFGHAMLAAMFAFGLLLFAGTFAIDASSVSGTDLGPKFLPRVFSLCLMFFAGLAFRLKDTGSQITADRMVVVGMAIAIGYALALTVVGYCVSTFATLCIVLFAIRGGTWWRIVLFAAIMTGAIYYVFEKLMTIGLPVGPWGF